MQPSSIIFIYPIQNEMDHQFEIQINQIEFNSVFVGSNIFLCDVVAQDTFFSV